MWKWQSYFEWMNCFQGPLELLLRKKRSDGDWRGREEVGNWNLCLPSRYRRHLWKEDSFSLKIPPSNFSNVG